MRKAYQLATSAMYQRSKPVRAPLYLRFVKRFPCAACGSSQCVDPAHTGPHAMSQKSSDMLVIPLCRKCHDAFDAGPRDFEARHQLDIAGLIAQFNELWEMKQRRTA